MLVYTIVYGLQFSPIHSILSMYWTVYGWAEVNRANKANKVFFWNNCQFKRSIKICPLKLTITKYIWYIYLLALLNHRHFSNPDVWRIERLSCLCYRTTIRFSIFFTRLWSVYTVLILDTQDPEISEFSTAHSYKYQTKQQAK